MCARVVPGLFADGQALGVLIPLSLRFLLLVVIAACTVSVGILLVALSVEAPLAFLVLPFVVPPFVALLTLGVPTGKEQ